MNCQHAFDRSFDDETGAASSEAVEHVATCLHCLRIRRAFERTRPLLRSLPAPSISPDFAARLERRIANMERARTRRVRRLRLGVGWGSAAAMAALLVLLMQPEWPPTPGARRPTTAAAPTVHIVRPLSSVGQTPGGGLFTALAAPDILDEPEPELAGAAAWSSTVSTTAERTTLAVPHAPRRWPAFVQTPGAYASPVVYAAPSWTFAGAPAGLQFVSSRGPATFPPLAGE